MSDILENLDVDIDIAINKKADMCVVTTDEITSSIAFEISRSNVILASNPAMATIISKQLAQRGVAKPVYHFEFPTISPTNITSGHGILLLDDTMHPAYNQLQRVPIVTTKSKKEIKKMLGIASDKWVYEEENPSIHSCIKLTKSLTCHTIKKFGLAGIPTISNNDVIKSQYVLDYITGITYNDPKNNYINADEHNLLAISDTTKKYYEAICANPNERLYKIKNGGTYNYNIYHNDDKPIYISKTKNARIKCEFYKAETLLEAVEKLGRLDFTKAYLIGYDEDLSQETKLAINIVARKMGDKIDKVIFCNNYPMPYRWGMQVVPTSYGIQLLS